MFTAQLYVGLRLNGTVIKEVTLLPTDGVAERIYTKKAPDKPYTWQGNVLTAAIAELGGEAIGAPARRSFEENKVFDIPTAIRSIPMPDVSSLLVEIHRQTWNNLIQRQTCRCRKCSQEFVMDIDLDLMVLSDEDRAKLSTDYESLTYDVKVPFEYSNVGKHQRMLQDFSGVQFNRIVFRIPLLNDAIRNEKFFSDSILFWRKIAVDCIQAIQYVENGTVVCELPEEAKLYMGDSLFNYMLHQKDRAGIRELLREELPSLPFYYEAECIHCNRLTPVSMEASNFFSD